MSISALTFLHEKVLARMTEPTEVSGHLAKLAHGNSRARAVWEMLHDKKGRYLHPTQVYWSSRNGEIFSMEHQRWMSVDESHYFENKK